MKRFEGKQISLNDIMPSDFENAVRHFADQEFTRRRLEERLPHIRNPHEAYGVLAECHQALQRANKAVKSDMDDALTSLPAGCVSFAEHVDQAYTACLDAARDAINMAVNAQNIAHALLMYQQEHQTPIDDMITETEAVTDEAEDVPEDGEPVAEIDPDTDIAL